LIFHHFRRADYESLSSFSCGDKELDDVFHNEIRLCAKMEFQTVSDAGKHTRRMYLDIFSQPS